jgi:hypothetical protein
MIAPTVLWLRESVLWVALLSIYALVITASGAEQAAEAAEASEVAYEMGLIEGVDYKVNRSDMLWELIPSTACGSGLTEVLEHTP